MMLFYRRPTVDHLLSRRVELGVGTGAGSLAGFLAGFLGVGGGNVVLPVLNGVGLDAKTPAGTTAMVVVVVISSLSGFLGRVSVGDLNAASSLRASPRRAA